MQFKKLAIITDCVHVFGEAGSIGTENHIFLKQMQSLASYFESTTICCPIEKFSGDKILSIYSNDAIKFIAVPNVGGNNLKDKIKLIKAIPAWLQAFKKAGKEADIVYQRFPNNLNIPGFFYFYFKRAKVFATYTGTWSNYKGEPPTYRFQKWLLKNFFRGPVWAYIKKEKQGDKILKSFSPSYTLQEWEEETQQVEQRVQRLQKGEAFTPVFITVGALVANKNQQYILNNFKILFDEGINFKLLIVGEGPLKQKYLEFIENNNLHNNIFITGKKTAIELRALYRQADFLVQAPLAEGFGKVPAEGFFHGVIPLLNDVSLAKEMTGDRERGFLFSAASPDNLAVILKTVLKDKKLLTCMIKNGREYARKFTLENWSMEFINKIETYFE